MACFNVLFPASRSAQKQHLVPGGELPDGDHRRGDGMREDDAAAAGCGTFLRGNEPLYVLCDFLCPPFTSPIYVSQIDYIMSFVIELKRMSTLLQWRGALRGGFT